MSTTSPSAPAPTSISADSTIGALVAAQPALARLFEKLDIDYCCGGKQTLIAACKRRGLDVQTTITLLESAGAMLTAGTAEVDAAAMSLTQLADHIQSTHHAYLKQELPRLVEMADRVAQKHCWRDARLPDMSAAVRELASEMLNHMQKEEIVLFPIVREIEANARPEISSADLASPIEQMEAEHQESGELVARLRDLTDNFTPNAEACNTHRALLAGLEEFSNDLHRHVHKENNVLFPRALALAATRH